MTADTIAAPVRIVEKGFSYSRSDLLAIEEPLQFCLNGSPLSITMRLPGSDLDLATGFLFTEGIVVDVGQILSMRAESTEDGSDDSGDRVIIRLKPEVAIDPSRSRRASGEQFTPNCLNSVVNTRKLSGKDSIVGSYILDYVEGRFFSFTGVLKPIPSFCHIRQISSVWVIPIFGTLLSVTLDRPSYAFMK
jgi:FdhD/NarQ family